jgi:hypothetical protein
MRKWIMWMDVIMLFTCLALLLIDLQIKNDIVAQATALKEKIDGQAGTTQLDSFHSAVPADILRGDDDDNSTLDTENPPEASVNAVRPRTRSSSAKRRTGNPDTGIQPDGEQVGS